MKRGFILFLGDAILLYGSLWLALFLRGPSFNELAPPFSLIFLIWVKIFYIAGLYDSETNQDRLEFYSLFWKIIIINGLIATAIFYLGIGYLKITPKTILFIQIIIFSLLFLGWRGLARSLLKLFPVNALVIGKLPEELKNNPAYRFTIVDGVFNFKNLIKEKNISLVVVASNPHLNPATTAELFQCLPLRFMEMASFYEQILKKIPLDKISRVWFLENISEKRMYEIFKRLTDIFLSVIGLVISLPFWPIIGLAIKWDSVGPVFYKQIRVGKNNKEFRIWKFRTMIEDAEKDKAQWAKKNDPRITKIGSLLRKTRLDELPQLANIIRGEMSLIGPRPERPEFTKELEKQIPFYQSRHLIKPGLTGWAQTQYRYGNSIEDAKKKLMYELYYVKNRSLALDIGILLKTIKTVISERK